MMKVCDVVINPIWYDPRVRKQIKGYLANGVETVAIGLKIQDDDFEKISVIPCKINLVEIDNRYVGKQRNPFKKIMRTYLRYRGVRDAILAERPDVIHANDLNALFPAFSAARKLKCGLIYDSHEVFVENDVNMVISLKSLLRAAEKYMVKRVDRMVCVSHAAAEYFVEQYNIPMPMVVTNCSLQAEAVDCNGIGKNPGFEILNHGQFYAGRGYDIMAQACPLLKGYPEVRLAIRGFGRMEQELHDMVDGLENKDQFLFYPRVAVQDLIHMAAGSHVG